MTTPCMALAPDIKGVCNMAGTLEVGKDATLFISKGDALDMRTNQLEYVWIQGRKVELNAMQQRLYQKYKAKYEAQKKE